MQTENLIIGAGPAGLAMAGRLSQAGLHYTLIEGSDHAGNAWRNHYDRLHLHTVKQFSHLPHMSFPEEYPTYVSKDQLVQYFEGYMEHFNIIPIYKQQVLSISKENGYYQVLTDSNSYQAKNIIVATGVNRVAHIPDWPGKNEFEGEILHSRQYKNYEPFIGKKTLVVGFGNTGAELCLDLSEHDVEVYASVRSPISVVPRDLNGRPVQVTSKQLAKLPFGLGDWLGSQIRKIYFGNLEKYGLKISAMHPAQQLRETGKTPIVDIGTMAAVKSGKIKVKPGIERFNRSSVVFNGGEEITIQSVILATGYRAAIQEFFPQISQYVDENGLPHSPIGKGELEGAYFLGFDNYKLGGILGTINSDSQLILDHLCGSA